MALCTSNKAVLSIGIASSSFIMWKLFAKKFTSSLSTNYSSKLSSNTNHLILHFDINKTIVMSDAVQGKGLKGVINDGISECSWGQVYNINNCPSNYIYNKSFIINNQIWKPISPYTITPIQPNNNLISFMSWIKQQHPYPNNKTDQIIKHKRRSYTLRFIELFNNQINEISETYINTYNQMLTKMETGNNGKPIYIIPAFWNCIHDLIKYKRSFSIIFRTFGTDIHDVMEAFNIFCRKYGYDGTQNNIPNLLLETANIGTINCDMKNGKSLIIGIKGRNPMDRTKEITNMSLNEFYKMDRMKWYYDKQSEMKDENIKILCNEEHIYEYIKNESLKYKTMMFSDDYLWWSIHGENSDGGKMFILDDNDKNIHQMFFDDNFEFDRAGIVDVRKLNVDNGKVCVSDQQWNKLKMKHLCKAEPVELMLNDNYFIEHIVDFESALAQTK
eukprot:143333_1